MSPSQVDYVKGGEGIFPDRKQQMRPTRKDFYELKYIQGNHKVLSCERDGIEFGGQTRICRSRRTEIYSFWGPKGLQNWVKRFVTLLLNEKEHSPEIMRQLLASLFNNFVGQGNAKINTSSYKLGKRHDLKIMKHLPFRRHCVPLFA